MAGGLARRDAQALLGARELLALAKRRLRDGVMAFVLFEDLATSDELMRYSLCLRKESHGGGGHSGRPKYNLSEMGATVRRYNAMDLELYEYAVKLFEARVAAMRAHKREGGVCGVHLAAPVVHIDGDDGGTGVCKLECAGGGST